MLIVIVRFADLTYLLSVLLYHTQPVSDSSSPSTSFTSTPVPRMREPCASRLLISENPETAAVLVDRCVLTMLHESSLHMYPVALWFDVAFFLLLV